MKTILFDLDGTLVNTEEGITKCAQYALEAYGIHEPDAKKLRFFIGPPLVDTFQEKYGMSRETALEATAKYRERYQPVGIYECKLYDGVEEILRNLKNRGYRVGVASSKPEMLCQTILEYFKIAQYFDEVVGATMDGKINTKIEVLNEAIRRMQLTNPDEVVLIGDTRFDALGAKEAGIDCIGVSYGFGTVEELEACGAVCICADMKEVEEYIEQQ